MEQSTVKQRASASSMADQTTASDQVQQTARRKKSGPNSQWTLTVLFVSLLLDLLGFTVILPLIPSLLEYYGRRDEVLHTSV